MSLTYAESGVDRVERDKAKKTFAGFEETYSMCKYGEPIKLPYNTIYPVEDKFNVKTCDTVGTKVLLSQLAEKHDTIGIDGIAMVVNDAIRCGAKPLALTNTIDVKKSTPKLLSELQKGLKQGAKESDCPMIGGETADAGELLNSSYNIMCDVIAEVEKNNVVDGKGIKPGDVVIGLRSSGVHSNGISLVRKALFKEWGGKYDAFEKLEHIGRELVFEILEPTKIYVKPVLHAIRDYNVKGAVHITGDAYLKFGKLFDYSPGIGFKFNNFKPQPIFELIQKQGVSWPEMFKTFNMGWGFALIVPKEDVDGTLQLLGDGAEVIGDVTDNGKIVVEYLGESMELDFE